jgi:hypothetical protein
MTGKEISLQAGYRWLSMDYEAGSGADRIRYDTLDLVAQFKVTIHF